MINKIMFQTEIETELRKILETHLLSKGMHESSHKYG